MPARELGHNRTLGGATMILRRWFWSAVIAALLWAPVLAGRLIDAPVDWVTHSVRAAHSGHGR